MIAAASYARDNGIPCLGLCLGLQVMVISVACAIGPVSIGPTPVVFDSTSPHPVIDLMPDQADVTDKGGTMRLGSYQATLVPGTKVAQAYGTLGVTERHRHRFEFNNRYRSKLEAVGLICSGSSPDGQLVEFVELSDHPFWVGTQAHPRVQEPSRPRPIRSSVTSLRPPWIGLKAGEPHLLDLDAVTWDCLEVSSLFRKVSEVEVFKGWMYSVGEAHGGGSGGPAVSAFRHSAPRRRGGCPGSCRPHGDARAPIPGRGRRHGLGSTRRDL